MDKTDKQRWQAKKVTQAEPSIPSLRGKSSDDVSDIKGFIPGPSSLLSHLWLQLKHKFQGQPATRQVRILKDVSTRYLRGHIQSVEIGLGKISAAEAALTKGEETEARMLFAEAIRMDRDTRLQQKLLSLGCDYQCEPHYQSLAESLFEMLTTLHLPGTLDRFAGPTDSLAADGERVLVSPRVAAEARFRLGALHYNKGTDNFPRAAALLEVAKPHDDQLCAERDYLLAMIHLHRAPKEDNKAAFIAKARQLLDSAALQGYTPALSQLETMS